jgi:hypothetical protein
MMMVMQNQHDNSHHDPEMMMLGMGNDDHIPLSDGASSFCEGMGMVMYMEGFQWSLAKGTQHSCLNFYFPSWTLNTRNKFIAAMICIVLMGILTEGIGRFKHDISKKARRLQSLSTSRSRNGSNGVFSLQNRLWYIQTILQGLSVFMAYVLMLVVMTYSLEMLCCVILGLVIGYFVFGGDLYQHSSSPCCQFLEEEDDEDDNNEATVAATLMRAFISPSSDADHRDDDENYNDEGNDEENRNNNTNDGYAPPSLTRRRGVGGGDAPCCSGT